VKTFVRTSIALCVALVGALSARADFSKPVAIVALASYDQHMVSVDLLGEMFTGQPKWSQQLDFALAFFTGGKGLKGIDRTRPIGEITMPDGQEEPSLFFVPTTNFKDLLGLLSILGSPQEDGEGIYKFSPPQLPGKSVYVREHNGWAFMSQVKYAGALPDDPVTLLGGLEKEYDVAFRSFLQNVSPSQKQEMLAQAGKALNKEVRSDAPISEALQREINVLRMRMIERFLTDADQVTLGWKFDKTAKNTYIDFNVTAAPGTSLAEGLQAFTGSKTDLAGFLNPAFAIQALAAQTHSKDCVDYMLASSGVFRKAALEAVDKDADLASDEHKQSVKAALNELFDAIDNTFKSGQFEAGLALNLAPSLQLATGAKVADGAVAEKAVKDIIELAKGEPWVQENVTFTPDAETYKDVRFHQIKIKLPPTPKAQELFGESAEIYIGIGAKTAYLAAGKESLPFIKSIIDASAAAPGKAVLPLEVNLSVADVAGFVLKNDSSTAATLAEKLTPLKGKDKISLTLKPASGGVNGRLEVEAGALEAIATIFKGVSGKGAPPQGGPSSPF
jgi:hypothetical protein